MRATIVGQPPTHHPNSINGYSRKDANLKPLNEARNPILNASSRSLQLEVYPMLGHRHPRRDGWRVLVQGRIVRDAELTLGKRLLLKGLQRALRNTGESVTSQLFFDRVEGFLAAPEQRRRVYIDIDGTSYRLRRKSKSSGLFVGKLDLPEGVFGNLMSRANRGYATASVQVHIVGENSTTAVGEIFLASPSGISVVSDIDDTIKRTCVTSRREMLAQTFCDLSKPSMAWRMSINIGNNRAHCFITYQVALGRSFSLFRNFWKSITSQAAACICDGFDCVMKCSNAGVCFDAKAKVVPSWA